MLSCACCLVICLATCIWFWGFILVLNTSEQYFQQHFKKWVHRVTFWWWEFRWVGHQSGRAGTLPSIGDLILRGGRYPSSLYGLFIKQNQVKSGYFLTVVQTIEVHHPTTSWYQNQLFNLSKFVGNKIDVMKPIPEEHYRKTTSKNLKVHKYKRKEH